MAYEFDAEATAEAERFLLSDERIEELRSLVGEKLKKLGSAGVRSHTVTYEPEAWGDLLPPRVLSGQSGSISRGDVFDLAAEGDLIATFAASFLWGSGGQGYGPHRYTKIVKGGSDRLGEMLAAAVSASKQDLIGGYEMLFGGPDQKRRTAPMTAPWARLADFGPAFFTKLLYFTHPQALILDNVLANAVSKLSGMPYLVNSKGGSRSWSSYRYSVYLHWMRLTSSQLNCLPDELELTLFAPPNPAPV